MQLAVTDLFVVGLGFDLVGGWLLARGLIARPGIIVHRHTSYLGTNAPSAYAAAEDRVDGQLGVASLLLGFLLQAVGYVLTLAHGEAPTYSAGRALTALALLAVAVVLALGVWRRIRPRLLHSLLVDMAHWTVTRATEPPVRQSRADPTALASWAAIGGEARRDGEDDRTYAKRVFRLSDSDLTDVPPPSP